jgi:membrane protein DedA with SNARE-associated domain
MSDWVTSIVESHGWFAVLALMFLENVVPPIPSELIMPLAGFHASRGRMSFIAAVIAGTAGSVLGAVPLYYLGRFVGRDRLRRWIVRHGHWLALSPDDFDAAGEWFEKHCGSAVFLCRLVPGVRSLISIPAGLHGMSMPKFLIYTAAGTCIWATLLALLGRLLGENYGRVEKWLGPLTYVIIGGVVIVYVIRVIRLRRKAHRDRAAS